MNKLKPLLALPILGLLTIAYACSDVSELAQVNETEEAVADLDNEAEPYALEYLDPTSSNSSTMYEEREVDLSPVIEIIEGETLRLKSIFSERELQEYIDNTIERSSASKKYYVTTPSGKKLRVKLSETEVIEQPIPDKGN